MQKDGTPIGDSSTNKAAAKVRARAMARLGGSRSFPPRKTQMWNLTKSLASFVSDGCKLVTPLQYSDRLNVCEACDRRENRRCLECGCGIDIKARGRAFECPLEKWAKS